MIDDDVYAPRFLIVDVRYPRQSQVIEASNVLDAVAMAHYQTDEPERFRHLLESSRQIASGEYYVWRVDGLHEEPMIVRTRIT